MRLLRLISWPYLKKHAVRSLLTVIGIVLGVAVFVAMHTANQAVFFAFERTVDRIAGAAQLQVTAGEAGFPEEVLERVQAIPEVQVAVPVIEAPAGTRLSGQGNILILGVDMTGDRSLREYDLESGDEAVIDDPLVFLAQPDSIIITNEFSERNNLDVGDRLTLSTMVGDKPFTVRGIMRSGGLTSAFGGNLAIMDIYAAQQVFGRGRRFDRIDLKLRDGVAVDAGQASIRKVLGVGFDVEPPASRGQQLESTLAVYAISMNVSECVCALHRHVHHLQLILDCRHSAAIGDWDSAGARRTAPADQKSLPHRECGERSARFNRRHWAGHCHGARHGGIDLQHARGHLRRCRACRGSLCRSAAARRCHRHRYHDQHDCGLASRAERIARRSGAGAAEREVSGSHGRREPSAATGCCRVDEPWRSSCCGSGHRSGSMPATRSSFWRR